MKEQGKTAEGGSDMREKRQQGRGGLVRTVGSFALGAVLGSVIALLYAPASGRVTRKRIGLKIRTLQRTTARQLGHAGKLLARKADGLREVATEKFNHAREWVAERVTNGNGRRLARRHRALHHA